MYPIIKRTTDLAAFVAILTTLCFTSCSQSEIDSLLPGNGESPEGDRIALTIGEVIIPAYNQTAATRGASDDTPDSEDLFNEWVPIEECNVTRAIDAASDMCVMRLCQDTVPTTTGTATRANLATNAKIRLIAFYSTDNSFAGVGDYTVNGTTITPVGSGLVLKAFKSYKIVGYTFNNTASLGTAASTYTWNSTAISIPDLNNDFLTCTTSISNYSETNRTISLSFSHQLSKMSLVLVKGSDITSISAASNVTISNGGASTTWKVGASGVETSTAASQKFSTTATGTSSAVRIVPYPSNHTVSVTFPSITINGQSKSNITVSSASAVSIQPGKTYTMTITFKKKIGVDIPEGDITQCSGSDKTSLSSVTFAPGNLIQPGNTTGAPTFAGSTSDYGHYYCWLSDWMGEGSTNRNGKDPCQSVIGQGNKWYTPSYSLIQLLARCTNKQLVSNGNKGMWFGGVGKGLFLPAAGYRNTTHGSGTTAPDYAGRTGDYWSKQEYSSNYGYYLYFNDGNARTSTSNDKTTGHSLRCVQGAK